MSKWWYYSIAKCPGCGATDERYDASGPWCDSGLSHSPTFSEWCEECWWQIKQAEEAEEVKEQEQAL